MSELPDPKRDGFDHINVYTKGKTEVGRLLTNPARAYFRFPNLGDFESVEGFWYWYRCYLLGYAWSPDQKTRIKTLRGLYGLEAKRHGKAILDEVPKEAWENFPEAEFREGIKEAIKQKLMNNQSLQKLIVNTSLPFAHYYWYGEEDNPAVRLAGHEWILEILEEFRLELKIQHSKAIIYRISLPHTDPLVFVDQSEERLENIERFFRFFIGFDEMTPEDAFVNLPRFKPGWEDEDYRRFIKTSLFYELDGVVRPFPFYEIKCFEETGYLIKEQ